MSAVFVGTTELDLDGVDSVTAAEIEQSVRSFRHDFPRAASTLTNVCLEPAEDDFVFPPESYAVTEIRPALGACRIFLNPRMYATGTRALLVKLVTEDLSSGFHRYPLPAGGFEHELGHVLDAYLARAEQRDPYSYELEYRDSHTISEYARQGGEHEAFADAFANWREGVRPLGNEPVRRVLSDAVRAAGCATCRV